LATAVHSAAANPGIMYFLGIQNFDLAAAAATSLLFLRFPPFYVELIT
jgi:hypothetical protein